jgi:isopenicillin-N epimerase
MSSVDWERVRDRMLFPPAVVYLNAGSFGPLPRAVHDAAAGLRRSLASDPADFLLRQVPSLLWRAREELAGFVGCSPHRLLFTSSVSAAVSLVASSLTVEAPGEILLSDQEYRTMRWCWERVAQRTGLSLRTFSIPLMPTDPEEIVAAAVDAMGARTRLIFFSHIVSASGLVLPARRICEEAQRRGIISVVDGAHAVASTALDLAAIPCDFYVGSCHKWLLAPSGASFLYAGRDGEDRLQPTTISWGYPGMQAAVDPDARDPYGSTPRLRRLECEGTRDLCPWLAVPDAIGFHRSFGAGTAFARMRDLAGHARASFADLDDFAPATPADAALSGALIAFDLPPALRRIDLARLLRDRFRIEVAVVDHLGQPRLRLSPHVYNTTADIDAVVEALSVLLADAAAGSILA